MTDPAEWYKSMPSVTKFILTASFGVTLAANFGLFNPMSLILDFGMIWNQFEIWRLFTAFAFFGKLGFPFLMNMYFMYSYSLRLETTVFEHAKGDYAYMLFICSTFLLIIGYLLELPILGVPLVIAILYVWCIANANTIVSFWFGTTFKAFYLPWVLAGFNVLLGGSGVMEILGIVAGHSYHFLKYIMPVQYGYNLLDTPRIITDFFDPRARAQPTQRWGGGQRLGGD